MRTTVAIGLAMLLVSAAIWAGDAKKKPDVVEALIAKGLAEYRSGKTQEAIADLQKAIAMMQKSLQKGMAAFFPKPPPGWEAGKVESTAMTMGSGEQSGSWTQVTRRYARTKDKVTVTVTMVNAPRLIEAQKSASAAYRNPQMLKMLNRDPKTRIALIDQAGWFGWTVVNKGRSAQASAFSKGCLLTAQAGNDDEQALKAIWNAIDLKALAAAQLKPAPK